MKEGERLRPYLEELYGEREREREREKSLYLRHFPHPLPLQLAAVNPDYLSSTLPGFLDINECQYTDPVLALYTADGSHSVALPTSPSLGPSSSLLLFLRLYCFFKMRFCFLAAKTLYGAELGSPVLRTFNHVLTTRTPTQAHRRHTHTRQTHIFSITIALPWLRSGFSLFV